MTQAQTITEVIAALDNIISWSKNQKSRIGYFATLYRKMTLAVQQGILNNSFNDGPRMKLLDCIFANRYLHAWQAYVNKQPCSVAWNAAFDACNRNDLVVLQHLFLGINTHINLDLGIAAAEACPGDKIHSLENDFNKINTVIAVLMQNVQDDLAAIWFPLKALEKIANGRQESVLNFSIDAARKCSWTNALALSTMDGVAKENYINAIDNTVVSLAHKIINPGYASFILQPVLMMEDKNIVNLINKLQN